ncbi:MAG: hypothetical protein WKF71_11595 [Pyrinomonadaceae bacterium]
MMLVGVVAGFLALYFYQKNSAADYRLDGKAIRQKIYSAPRSEFDFEHFAAACHVSENLARLARNCRRRFLDDSAVAVDCRSDVVRHSGVRFAGQLSAIRCL